METWEATQETITLSDLLPVENYNPVTVRAESSGEYRLLWAVLEDAVYCYLHYVGHPSVTMQTLFREAVEWIESDEEEWLCSFISICRAFQIDPSYLRRGLRRCLDARKQKAHVAVLGHAA
jgi:hypothetical protein